LPLALANGCYIYAKKALAEITAMSYVRIWVHLVFATKNRDPFLEKRVRDDLHEHITENCREKGIFLKSIGGYTDHVHCLISLGKDQTIAKVVQLIKGESSFWINSNNLVNGKFSWQDDYFAVSVSESQLEQVAMYINNQEKHHSKKTFSEEVNEFMIRYGWQRITDNEVT